LSPTLTIEDGRGSGAINWPEMGLSTGEYMRMKKKVFLIAVLAVFATASTFAYAQRQGGNSQGSSQGSQGGSQGNQGQQGQR